APLAADAVDLAQARVVLEKRAGAVAHRRGGAAVGERHERAARELQAPDFRQFIAGKRNRPSGAAAGARTPAAVRGVKTQAPGHGECSIIVMPITGTSVAGPPKSGIPGRNRPLPAAQELRSCQSSCPNGIPSVRACDANVSVGALP